MLNFNVNPSNLCTVPASEKNEITKEYGTFLIGEINRGTIKAGVMRKTDKNGKVRYFKIG